MFNFARPKGAKDKRRRKRRRKKIGSTEVAAITAGVTLGGALVASKGFDKIVGNKANLKIGQRGIKLLNRTGKFVSDRATGNINKDSILNTRSRARLQRALGRLDRKKRKLNIQKGAVVTLGAASAGAGSLAAAKKQKKRNRFSRRKRN